MYSETMNQKNAEENGNLVAYEAPNLQDKQYSELKNQYSKTLDENKILTEKNSNIQQKLKDKEKQIMDLMKKLRRS